MNLDPRTWFHREVITSPEPDNLGTIPLSPNPNLYAAYTAQENTMSFFTTLKNDIEKLFGHTANYSHLALAAVTFAAPILTGILAITDAPLLPIVQPIITRLETGLATAYALSTEAGAGASLATVLTSVQSDLTQLEGVAGIKDAATQAKIATVVSEINAVLALLPPIPGITGAAAKQTETQG